MSDQMLSLYEVELQEGINDGDPYASLPTRRAALNSLAQGEAFDLLILGGGLLGVTVAHEAALQGIKVLLLSRTFFGVDALSWDVRIAHTLRTRPVDLVRGRTTFQMLGRSRAPHLITAALADSHALQGFAAKLAKRFISPMYVDEELLIRETALAARQEGATLLAGMVPTFVESEKALGCYVVGCKDPVTGMEFQNRVGGIVLDPTHGDLPPSRLGTYVLPSEVAGSAGKQFIFEVAPKTITSGVTFASFELSDGSFVSVAKRGALTVEATVLYGNKTVPPDALASVVHEACEEAGWSIVHQVSMREVSGRWSKTYGVSQTKGVFVCSHRAAWDAFRSAETIVKACVALSKTPGAMHGLSPKLLPGGDYACELDSFRAMARSHGISERTIEKVVERWRGRVRYLAQFPNGLREIVPGVLRGEVDLAWVSDHCVTVDDLVRGSLKLYRDNSWPAAESVLHERLEILSNATSLGLAG